MYVTTIRLDDDLAKLVRAAAKADGRGMNNWIVTWLAIAVASSPRSVTVNPGIEAIMISRAVNGRFVKKDS